MQLLAIKTFIKKAYVWIKNHWYIPLSLLAASVVWFFFRQKSQAMIENVKKTREAHKKEIDIISDAHKKEVLSRDRTLSKFTERSKSLDGSLKSKIEDLEKKETTRKDELANKNVEDLAQAFADNLTRTSEVLDSAKKDKK